MLVIGVIVVIVSLLFLKDLPILQAWFIKDLKEPPHEGDSAHDYWLSMVNFGGQIYTFYQNTQSPSEVKENVVPFASYDEYGVAPYIFYRNSSWNWTVVVKGVRDYTDDSKGQTISQPVKYIHPSAVASSDYLYLAYAANNGGLYGYSDPWDIWIEVFTEEELTDHHTYEDPDGKKIRVTEDESRQFVPKLAIFNGRLYVFYNQRDGDLFNPDVYNIYYRSAPLENGVPGKFSEAKRAPGTGSKNLYPSLAAGPDRLMMVYSSGGDLGYVLRSFMMDKDENWSTERSVPAENKYNMHSSLVFLDEVFYLFYDSGYRNLDAPQCYTTILGEQPASDGIFSSTYSLESNDWGGSSQETVKNTFTPAAVVIGKDIWFAYADLYTKDSCPQGDFGLQKPAVVQFVKEPRNIVVTLD